MPSIQSNHGLISCFKGPHECPSSEPTSVLDLATISPASSPGTSPNRFIAGAVAPSLHKSIIYRSHHMQHGSKYEGSCMDSHVASQALACSPTSFNTSTSSSGTGDLRSFEGQDDVLEILEGLDAEIDLEFMLKTHNTLGELFADSPRTVTSNVGSLWDEPALDALTPGGFMDVQVSLSSVDETLPPTTGDVVPHNVFNNQPDVIESPLDGKKRPYGLFEANNKVSRDMSESMASPSTHMANLYTNPNKKCMFPPLTRHTRSPEVIERSPDSPLFKINERDPFMHPGCNASIPTAKELTTAANSGSTKCQEEKGLQLVHLLLGCAEMVGERQYDVVQPLLRRLQVQSSPEGNPMERIAFYFSETLLKRVAAGNGATADGAPTANHMPLSDYAASLSQHNIDRFHLALYQALPYTKFLHFTANQAILEAVADSSHVHVIDFDIQLGIQWPNFFQSLAVRPHGPPKQITISAIGPCISRLNQTGRMLGEFAGTLGLRMVFFPIVVKNVQELHLGMFNLGIKGSAYDNHDSDYDESDNEDGAEEAIAVNLPAILHSQIWDGVTVENFLRIVKNLKPKVFTILKAERHNDAPSFVHKFIEVLFYYSALFDSLEVSLERSSPERAQIERVVLSYGLRNILSAGDEKLAMEASIEKWQACLDRAGFHQTQLSNHTLYQARLLLDLYASQAFRIESSHETSALSIGWKETPLFTVMVSSSSSSPIY